MEKDRFTFLSPPPLWGLRDNVRYVRLGLIGERIVDFLLVLIEVFSLSVTT